LLLGVCGSLAAAVLIVMSPIGGIVGFVPLPPAILGVLAVLVVSYLVLVQLVKRRVYAASGWSASEDEPRPEAPATVGPPAQPA
jgi:hypothetical protein